MPDTLSRSSKKLFDLANVFSLIPHKYSKCDSKSHYGKPPPWDTVYRPLTEVTIASTIPRIKVKNNGPQRGKRTHPQGQKIILANFRPINKRPKLFRKVILPLRFRYITFLLLHLSVNKFDCPLQFPHPFFSVVKGAITENL